MDEFSGFEEQKEFASWLEEGVATIFGSGKRIKSACVVAIFDDESAITAYFQSDAQDMAVFAHKINTDIIMEIVTNNIDIIRDALEGETEDEL